MAEWAFHVAVESRWAGVSHTADSWREHNVYLVQLCIIAFRVGSVFPEMLKHFVLTLKDTSLSVWGKLYV